MLSDYDKMHIRNICNDTSGAYNWGPAKIVRFLDSILYKLNDHDIAALHRLWMPHCVAVYLFWGWDKDNIFIDLVTNEIDDQMILLNQVAV